MRGGKKGRTNTFVPITNPVPRTALSLSLAEPSSCWSIVFGGERETVCAICCTEDRKRHAWSYLFTILPTSLHNMFLFNDIKVIHSFHHVDVYCWLRVFHVYPQILQKQSVSFSFPSCAADDGGGATDGQIVKHTRRVLVDINFGGREREAKERVREREETKAV